MVLGVEWGEFGVWVCGELFFVAEFYEEGEVYCCAAGYDIALVCGYGDCEFGLFFFFFWCCSVLFLGCFVHEGVGACASLRYLLLKELEGSSFGQLFIFHQSTGVLLLSYEHPCV